MTETKSDELALLRAENEQLRSELIARDYQTRLCLLEGRASKLELEMETACIQIGLLRRAMTQPKGSI